jgi:two-component system, chemotaxis family, protein-glutamate methylesterase/glutaminase
MIVIGASLGGTQALQSILAALPMDFLIAIAIVQHRGAGDNGLLHHFLQKQSPLPIEEPEDKEEILAGHIYLAPADYHLLIESNRFALSTEAPVCHARPSIDVLFTSVAQVYAERALGIILTGASHDGASGLATIKQHGGFTLVQDPKTAACPIMPTAALEATSVDAILPLNEISSFLVHHCRSRHW